MGGRFRLSQVENVLNHPDEIGLNSVTLVFIFDCHLTEIRMINPQRTKVFFVTIRTKGGGHFDPPAKSETEEATTMKFCTVIAYYNTSITK